MTFRAKGQIVKAIDVGGRPLPSDRAAEAAVVGTCVASPGAFQECRTILAPGDFDAPSHARMWEVMQALDDAGKPLDQITIATALRARDWHSDIGGESSGGAHRGAHSFLFHLLELAGEHAHAVEWARDLAQLAQKRRILSTIAIVSGEGYAGTTVAADQYAGWSLDQVVRACDVASLSTMQSIGDVAKSRRAVHLEQWNGKREPWGLRLPFPRLHAILHGLGLGEVTFVSALEGGGKSVFAEQVGLSIAGSTYDGEVVGVAYLTLEMPKESVTDRALCHRAEITWKKLQAGFDIDNEDGMSRLHITHDEIARIDAAHAYLDALPFEVDDADKDLARIRAAARQAQAKLRAKGARLRLLVVDHVHILDLEGDNYTKELAACVRGLKRIAVEMGVHVLALAQFTQEAGRREGPPVVGDIRDAAAVKQIADKIVLIHRPWAKITDKDSDEAHRVKRHAEFRIVKNRNGAHAVVPATFAGEFFAFREGAPPEAVASVEATRSYAPSRSRFRSRPVDFHHDHD